MPRDESLEGFVSAGVSHEQGRNTRKTVEGVQHERKRWGFRSSLGWLFFPVMRKIYTVFFDLLVDRFSVEVH